MKKLLFVFGTRPEAIKMAPLILAARSRGAFDVRVCSTGQHRELLTPVLDFFDIKLDHNLDVMTPDQTLNALTSKLYAQLDRILEIEKPDLVFVQGDTTSAMVGAMTAFHRQIPVAHVEAGLRTGDRTSPFPEEMNRQVIGRVADLHFAPTATAVRALAGEKVAGETHKVGNTVVDALFLGLEKIDAGRAIERAAESFRNSSRKLVLTTLHRRENFGAPLEGILRALAASAARFPEVDFVFPVHPNPRVKAAVADLPRRENIHLIEPVNYPTMLWLLRRCDFVLTDSGGLQEEGPSLKKPVLVLRQTTERPEGLEAGTSVLVGTEEIKVRDAIARAITDPAFRAGFSERQNPYGDGHASEKILDVVQKFLNGRTSRQPMP